MVKFKDINSLSDSERQRLKDQPESFRIAYAATEIQKICYKSGHSQFFPYGGEGYKSSVRHYLESSSEVAYAAVQPGTPEVISKIIKVLAVTKAPFAVRGGGHATNPKFSSTRGIQISLARFNKIQYHKDTQTLDVGAGCLFDEVYRALDGTGRNIVGGSAIAGVGIAGWLLGGGYSLKSNQYGLGIDNILGIKIVTPDGDITSATKNYNGKLFNAVRGGGNNFGIVTEFKLKTHAQSPTVYGGLLEYEAEDAEEVKNAVVDFVDNSNDPKAAIVAAFRYFNRPGGQQFKLTVQYFYDGPKPEIDPFQNFINIPHNLVLGNGAGAGQEQPGAKSNLSYFEFDHTFSELHDDTIVDVIDQHEEQKDEFDFKDNDLKTNPYLEGGGDLDYSSFVCEYEHKNCGIDHVVDETEVENDVHYYEPAPALLQQASFSPDLTNSSSSGRWGNGSLSPDGKNDGNKIIPKQKRAVSFPLRAMVGVGENARGRWGNVMVSKYTREIVDEVERQAKRVSKHLVRHHGKTVVVDIWPFVPGMFKNSDHNTAWPHKDTNGPLVAIFQWEGQENDEFWVDQMKRTLKALGNKAYGPGQKPNRPVYINNTLAEVTTVEDVYRENLVPLGRFRAVVDPEDVMGQTGGFKIPIQK